MPFAIRSVLSQTIADFELLIAGDGCTDETGEVVKGFADERIRWFDLPKAPHYGYANRNVALREARGELVAYMQHDDLWLPDHLELLAQRLEQQRAEIVYSLPVWVLPQALIAPLVFNLHHPETLNFFLARERNGIPSVCVVHRRECFDKYGYWNADLPSCADWDMWARIIEGGGRKNFAYLAEPTCLHFRANWRNETNHGPPQLAVWQALHAIHDFTPSSLKLEVPPDITEQEACWLGIEEDSQSWSAELRAAVQTVLERRVSLSDDRILSLLGSEGTRFHPDKLLENYAFDHFLSDKVREQQQKIESLLALGAERQREIDSLKLELSDRRAKVLKLAEQVAEWQKVVDSLTTQLAEQREKVLALVEQIAERQGAVESLAIQLAERHERVLELVEHIGERQRAVDSLVNELAENNEKVATLTTQVAERKAELEKMRSTLGWRLLKPGKVTYKSIGQVFRSGSLDKNNQSSAARTANKNPTPSVIKTRQATQHQPPNAKDIFTQIYHRNEWGDSESVSGPGSSIARTSVVRAKIAVLLEEFGVRSLLDAGCGDFNWMKEVKLDLNRYIGADVVPELILENRRKYGDATRSFLITDITRDKLPRVDVILSRDCLVHLSFDDIFAAIQNFKESGSTYLLTTTFASVDRNTEINTGAWRPLNLQLFPFDFPAPLKLIDEKRAHQGVSVHKYLALWTLQELPQPEWTMPDMVKSE